MSVYLYTLRKTGTKNYTAPNNEKIKVYPFKFACSNAGHERYNYKTYEWELPAYERRSLTRAETSFTFIKEDECVYVEHEGVLCLQPRMRTFWYDTGHYTGFPVAIIGKNKTLLPLSEDEDTEYYSAEKLKKYYRGKINHLNNDFPSELKMWLQFNGIEGVLENE